MAKKFKKLKNTVMTSFQAKIGWKMVVKERKQKLSFHSVLTQCVIENFKKIAKKLKILKKYHYSFISIQNRLEKAEKDKK